MDVAEPKVMPEDAEPKVRRMLWVPLDIRPDHLHSALQAALGWDNDHPCLFRVGQTTGERPVPMGVVMTFRQTRQPQLNCSTIQVFEHSNICMTLEMVGGFRTDHGSGMLLAGFQWEV